MAQIIGLPKLSPTMEEGILIRWVLKEGDSVEPGDLIAEVETDKANMDFSLEDEGVLLKFLVAEGTTVRLGAPVLILGEEGEDITAIVKEAEAQLAGGSASDSASTPAPEAVPAPASASSTSTIAPLTPASSGGRLLASPLAKTLAIELGIDLRQLQGSGPGGRIVERDVRKASGGTASVAQVSDTALAVVPAPAPILVPEVEGDYEDIPLSNIRKTIAQRLTAAARDIPQFRLSTSFEAAPLLAFRKRLNELMAGRGKVSVNDLLIKGVALALRQVPEVNVAFLGDAVRQFSQVHVGVAVALERGLMTPVVRNADLKGLGVISNEVKDLVGRAKDRKIKAHEIQGSTFTISNLGMFGIDHFDAIINPPEGAILAVGRIVKQPVFDDEGNVTVGQRMNLTMTCDHRVIDGAVGARFLDALVALLEQPESLAL
ncbi:MAG: pyruvate dehydrogenase complex dihydrolipoamide acetyltransferase [Kofleriaceae bacterium]|nr:pyruvate dehydrogenase complex dihydrolipoamide acetyltransferase [Kofleriaceae bacterium]